MKKKVKITKREHSLEGYASTYNVEIFVTLNYNLKILNLQLKVT